MKQRESNIELLRILAMFLVMAVHVNDVALGHVTSQQVNTDVLSSSFRLIMEALAVVCVDVFVLISGWFGIRPSGKGLAKFVFQCCFFYVLLSTCFLITGAMSCADFGKTLIQPNWFIIAYIGLYLLSPILNIFIERTPRKLIVTVTACVWAWLLYFGWIGGVTEFVNGYSTIALVGLYLVGRCLRLYQAQITAISKTRYLLIYIMCAVVSAGICFCSLKYDVFTWLIPYKTRSYISPIVVIESIALLLLFAKVKLSSPLINKLAAGAFGVYLLHLHPVVFPIFTSYAAQIWMRYNNQLWLYVVIIVAYMTVFYLAGFVLDMLREWCWRPIVAKWDKMATKKASEV